MSKHRKKQGPAAARSRAARRRARQDAEFQRLYDRANRLAKEGQHQQARRLYEALELKASDASRQALIGNDLAALSFLAGDISAACQGFRGALALDDQCQPARANLALIEPPNQEDHLSQVQPEEPMAPLPPKSPARPIKVAILSFLFNWPSTGGGIVHTVELCRFLAQAGFEVQHFHACFPLWEIGRVDGKLPFNSQALTFEPADWTVPAIQEGFRRAVDAFAPDHVLITDSWNMKPLLAEAVRAYPYILRFQAMECLCPLNNVRLIPDGPGGFRQCSRHQLANPEACCACLLQNGRFSGGLHQAERELAGVGSRDYYQCLLTAYAEAEAVLVVNPLHEAMVSPYADRVRVVTAGMDPARFPWPWPTTEPERPRKTVLFAGLVQEPMKGFEVLHAACELLWPKRQDFELVATADPPGQQDAFTRFIGWQNQDALPQHLHAATLVAIPTIAQEALGRAAVEAMAAGRPVVASRLGGLPFTVIDGATGLLCEPGDPADLADKIAQLLDDADLCKRLGRAGRRRFEEHYAWPVIIQRHDSPLFKAKFTTENTEDTERKSKEISYQANR